MRADRTTPREADGVSFARERQVASGTHLDRAIRVLMESRRGRTRIRRCSISERSSVRAEGGRVMTGFPPAALLRAAVRWPEWALERDFYRPPRSSRAVEIEELQKTRSDGEAERRRGLSDFVRAREVSGASTARLLSRHVVLPFVAHPAVTARARGDVLAAAASKTGGSLTGPSVPASRRICL
jgi:hypothetical protein